MKVLIIGGTGLISTAITRALVARGEEVTLCNRGRSRSSVPAGTRSIVVDRTDYRAFEQCMAELGSFDCVVDMVGYRPADAESIVRAFRGKTEQLLFCSTVDVYQKPARGYPIKPGAPRAGLNDYARNKTAQENTLLEAHRRGDFAATILRPAFTYGEGRGLVHSFGGSYTYFDRLRRGKPIVVHGDGTSLWTACHRDDVGAGFAAAAGNPKTYGRCYNVAGGEWLTWDQYHQTVARSLSGPEPRLVHIPTDLLIQLAPERAGICSDNFQFNNIFDQSGSHEDFGFRYTIPFAEGTARIIAWLDANQQIPNSDDDLYDDQVIALWENAVDEMARKQKVLN